MSWFSNPFGTLEKLLINPALASINKALTGGSSLTTSAATATVASMGALAAGVASAEPAVAAASTNALNIVAQLVTPSATPVTPAGVTDQLVNDLQTGLQSALDAFVTGALGTTPAAGFAPEAVTAANDVLAFAENEAHALFGAAKVNVAAAASTPAS